MKVARYLFKRISSLVYIFECWNEFKRGKRKRKDIQSFERHLEDHLFKLHEDLVSLKYQHAPYEQFRVFDPKERRITKACVRDRLVHHMVHHVLSECMDQKFIFHSFSSRLGKGTHMGVLHLQRLIRQLSQNGKHPCYALKMDIKRFFDSINHSILKGLIWKKVREEKFLNLLDIIIDSFRVKTGKWGGVGIPLGNVTSQLFANIYLHELDDFIKQELHERYYLRYCDDFILLSSDQNYLRSLIALIRKFLTQRLHLEIHPRKISIRKLSEGIDFVGYVVFEHHVLVRTRTKQRMKRRLKEAYEAYLEGELAATSMDQRLQSYLGILSHADQWELSQTLKNAYGVREK
jgi:RNA-directed DNA polymerase